MIHSLSKIVILLTLLLSSFVQIFYSQNAFSNFSAQDSIPPYYPLELRSLIQNDHTTTDELKKALHHTLTAVHLKKSPTIPDELVAECPIDEKINCYNQRTDYTYKDARTFLFGELFLEKNDHQKFQLTDVYCLKTYTEEDGVNVGQKKIPDPEELNCEHTWPQSKFNKNLSLDVQKNDLHHLFPVNSRSNSVRSNHPFGELEKSSQRETHERCAASFIGTMKNSSIRAFLPPINHRGNVARAIFYFSIRYGLPIDDREEFFLKQWHHQDPVNNDEMLRNQKIYTFQKNRNPFVDFPMIVDRIHNF